MRVHYNPMLAYKTKTICSASWYREDARHGFYCERRRTISYRSLIRQFSFPHALNTDTHIDVQCNPMYRIYVQILYHSSNALPKRKITMCYVRMHYTVIAKKLSKAIWQRKLPCNSLPPAREKNDKPTQNPESSNRTHARSEYVWVKIYGTPHALANWTNWANDEWKKMFLAHFHLELQEFDK